MIEHYIWARRRSGEVHYGAAWFILGVWLRANGHGHKLHSLNDVFAYRHLSPLAPTAPAKPTMSLIVRQHSLCTHKFAANLSVVLAYIISSEVK
jgi:hypothetical protein